MRWVLGLAFLGFAAWALIPDTLDEEEKPNKYGPFLTTLVAFFIAEIGDKTQFATVALGAQYANLSQVVVGTTLGMMAANVPAVLLGERLARYIPLAKMRFVAAALFAIFGAMVLAGVNFGLGLGSA
jgi:putative Ca2+/H+ antiporter (TMEM165/GDT1 family)